MHLLLVLAALFGLQTGLSDRERTVLETSTPDFLSPTLARPEIDLQYELSSQMNPFYLCGGFDDVKGLECAIFLQRKQEPGNVVLVFLSSRWEPYIIYDSTKLGDHAPLQGWQICYWSTCGSAARSGKEGYSKQSEIPYGKDTIILHYGGGAELWYWSKDKFRSVPWGE